MSGYIDVNIVNIEPPIEFQQKQYSVLELREPTIGEVITGDQQLRNGMTSETVHRREVYILARVANVPVPVIEKLPVSLHNRAWSYVANFLSDGLATGGS